MPATITSTATATVYRDPAGRIYMIQTAAGRWHYAPIVRTLPEVVEGIIPGSYHVAGIPGGATTYDSAVARCRIALTKWKAEQSERDAEMEAWEAILSEARV